MDFPGDKLLPCSVLSCYQHVRVCPGYLSDNVHHVDHRRRSSLNDPFPAVVYHFLQLPVVLLQRGSLKPRQPELHGIIDGSQKPVPVGRLENEIRRPLLYSPDSLPDVS